MGEGLCGCYMKKLKQSYLYLIGEPLEHIVLGSCVGITGILYYVIHDHLQLLVCCVLEEFTLQSLWVEIQEAFHSFQLSHHHYDLHDFLLVLSEILDAQKEQQLEMLEDIRINTFHEFDIVIGELEGGSFEVHVAWRTREHEAEIDMDEVSEYIDQNVVIVPIFDVKVVLYETIPSQTLYEISQRGLPIAAKNLFIDVLQTSFPRHFFKVTYRSRVIYELN